jgi:hypothetical protein
VHASDARAALLGRLFDHAPMFPPASLPLAAALAADVDAQSSSSSWMLGRLVMPASAVPAIPFEQRALSVVLSGPVPSDARIEALEVPYGLEVDSGCDVDEIYVEVPLSEGFEDRLGELGATGLRAKVRCGGAAIPSVSELAAFIRTCRECGVVFKATAGLHHAFPTEAGEHGFVNVLAAVVFGDEEQALRAPRAALELDAESFRWDGRAAGAQQLARARACLFHSIGTCSFSEPVEELCDLGVL